MSRSFCAAVARFPAPAPGQELLRGGSHLRLGLSEIDREHEEIRQLLNALHAACKTGGREDWRPVFEQLGKAVHKHFRTEERLMRRHRDPGFEDHKGRHDSLLGRLAALEQAVQNGADIDEPVFLYLKGWLRDHVLGPDARMARYLRRCGER